MHPLSSPTSRRDVVLTGRERYTLVTGLYVSQFLGYGFFYTGLVAILRDRGVPLATLGAVQALGLIWGIKVLWAPVVDRFGSVRRGHYRSWLLWLQPAIVLALLALSPSEVLEDVRLVLVLAGVVVVLSATQDIATDAIAVRLFDRAERGVVNGIQVAASYLGNVIGGGVVLLVFDRAGWTWAVAALAVATAVPLAAVWRFREPAGTAAPTTSASFRAVLTMFREPGVARWSLMIMPLYGIGLGAGYSLLTPMLVDAGWSLARIGVTSSIIGGLVAVVAGLMAGVLVSRWDRRTALVALGALRVVALVCLVPLASGSAPVVGTTLVVCLLFAAHVGGSCAVNTVAMDLARTTSAGTDYTMMASIAHIVSLGSGAVVVAAAGALGYVTVLSVAIVLAVIGIILVAGAYRDTSPSLREGDVVTGMAEQQTHDDVL